LAFTGKAWEAGFLTGGPGFAGWTEWDIRDIRDTKDIMDEERGNLPHHGCSGVRAGRTSGATLQ
jgi:hypothetical protein